MGESGRGKSGHVPGGPLVAVVVFVLLAVAAFFVPVGPGETQAAPSSASDPGFDDGSAAADEHSTPSPATGNGTQVLVAGPDATIVVEPVSLSGAFPDAGTLEVTITNNRTSGEEIQGHVQVLGPRGVVATFLATPGPGAEHVTAEDVSRPPDRTDVGVENRTFTLVRSGTSQTFVTPPDESPDRIRIPVHLDTASEVRYDEFGVMVVANSTAGDGCASFTVSSFGPNLGSASHETAGEDLCRHDVTNGDPGPTPTTGESPSSCPLLGRLPGGTSACSWLETVMESVTFRFVAALSGVGFFGALFYAIRWWTGRRG